MPNPANDPPPEIPVTLCDIANAIERGAAMSLDKMKSFFFRDAQAPSPRRLDGRSEVLLAASMKMLAEQEPGWITMQEAKMLHLPVTPMRSASWTRWESAILRPLRPKSPADASSSLCLSKGGCISCAMADTTRARDCYREERLSHRLDGRANFTAANSFGPEGRG